MLLLILVWHGELHAAVAGQPPDLSSYQGPTRKLWRAELQPGGYATAAGVHTGVAESSGSSSAILASSEGGSSMAQSSSSVSAVGLAGGDVTLRAGLARPAAGAGLQPATAAGADSGVAGGGAGPAARGGRRAGAVRSPGGRVPGSLVVRRPGREGPLSRRRRALLAEVRESSCCGCGPTLLLRVLVVCQVTVHACTQIGAIRMPPTLAVSGAADLYNCVPVCSSASPTTLCCRAAVWIVHPQRARAGAKKRAQRQC